MKAAIAFCTLCVAALPALAQPSEPRPELSIARLPRAPQLEDFTTMAPPADLAATLVRISGFTQQVPEDGRPATQKTDVYLGYDDDHLYVVFVAFDDEPEKIRSHVSRRENVFDDETVEIQIDTFDDARRAFSFLTNPLGIQWDAIWTEGQGFDGSWDAVWQSRGRLTDRGYVVWMAIPFKSLRFPTATGASGPWRVIFVRDIPRNNETSFWPAVTSRIEGRLNQAATLRGVEGVEIGRNLQLIPYATGTRFRIEEATASGGTTLERDGLDPDAGLDAKWVLRDTLALDLTLNPDFSQVESDQPQVTVNERFEVFFPEKRPFFLENADYFRTPINLLFTRRIVDPDLGARLTGQLGRWSLGGLLIDDGSAGRDPSLPPEFAGEDARFGVFRVNRDLGGQSTIGLLYTDREFGDTANRVGGADARIRLDDNWDTRLQAVYARTRGIDGATLADPAYNVEFNRTARNFNMHLHYVDIGPEFRTEAGFVNRTDIRDSHAQLNYNHRPSGKALVRWRSGLYAQRVADHDGTRLDETLDPSMEWEFRGRTTFGIQGRNGRIRLRPEDVVTLTADRDYEVESLGVWLSTAPVALFGADVEYSDGRTVNFAPAAGIEPELADRRFARVQLRLRPVQRMRWDMGLLWTRLDDRSSGAELLSNRILRTRIDWQFSPRLSLRAIVEQDRTVPNPALTRVSAENRWNGDLLVTYLVNPWTAAYVGYNSNWLRDPLIPGGAGMPLLADDLRNDARQLFVKVSYLFQL